MDVGQRIIQLPSRKGWSQGQLSDVSGVPQSTISGIENAQKVPGLVVASKLAKALDVTIEDFLKDDNSIPMT